MKRRVNLYSPRGLAQHASAGYRMDPDLTGCVRKQFCAAVQEEPMVLPFLVRFSERLTHSEHLRVVSYSRIDLVSSNSARMLPLSTPIDSNCKLKSWSSGKTILSLSFSSPRSSPSRRMGGETGDSIWSTLSGVVTSWRKIQTEGACALLPASRLRGDVNAHRRHTIERVRGKSTRGVERDSRECWGTCVTRSRRLPS